MTVAEPGRRGWPTPRDRPKLARFTWEVDGVRYSIWYDPKVGLPPGWDEHRRAAAEQVDP